MGWPTAQDHNEAIQNPLVAFSDPDLRRGEAVANALGISMPHSGNFADIYQLRCPDGNTWAVKCFTREVPGLRQRYSQISNHLAQAKLPFTVGFQYLEDGIRVGGNTYPIVKMPWVDGLLLNEFVRANLDKRHLIEKLRHIWMRMGLRLREARMAHADLQHGNVILIAASNFTKLSVRLIDYDGIFVPALAAVPSGESGHSAYQHPQRARDRIYSAELDRFPLLSVYCAPLAQTPLLDQVVRNDGQVVPLSAIREKEVTAILGPGPQIHRQALRAPVKETERRVQDPFDFDEILAGNAARKNRIVPMHRRRKRQAVLGLGLVLGAIYASSRYSGSALHRPRYRLRFKRPPGMRMFRATLPSRLSPFRLYHLGYRSPFELMKRTLMSAWMARKWK